MELPWWRLAALRTMGDDGVTLGSLGNVAVMSRRKAKTAPNVRNGTKFHLWRFVAMTAPCNDVRVHVKLIDSTHVYVRNLCIERTRPGRAKSYR